MEYIIWVYYSGPRAEKWQKTHPSFTLSNQTRRDQNLLVEKDFSSSFALHRGAESKRHSAFQPKPNSVLFCLTVKPHINPKSHRHRLVNTLHPLSHPCRAGLVPVFKACVKADGSHLIRIRCNLLLVGKKILPASPTNVKPGKFNPLLSFVRCFATVLPTDPAMIRENTCFLFTALTAKKPSSDNSGNG